MKNLLVPLILILLIPITSFSQNTSRRIQNDSTVLVTTEQLRYTNLIFAEHSRFLEENSLLNTLVENYKLKVQTMEEIDTYKSLQLSNYKEITENYAIQISDLWKIGCFTIGIGALLYILLK